MSDTHEVNKEKLKRFLTELLLTRGWSDEFEELEPDGKRYWTRVLNLGLIQYTPDDPVYVAEVSTAGRKWLDEQS